MRETSNSAWRKKSEQLAPSEVEGFIPNTLASLSVNCMRETLDRKMAEGERAVYPE